MDYSIPKATPTIPTHYKTHKLKNDANRTDYNTMKISVKI
jgi:hypothetical protein